MSDFPPLMRDQRVVDTDHLHLLAVFHFVIAGLSFLSIGGLIVQFFIMREMFSRPEIWQGIPNPPPPEQMLMLFEFLCALGAFAAVGYGSLNLISGFCLRSRTYRSYSLVIAALNCLYIPFGTILGVFTFIVLMRDSVRDTYDV